MSMIEFIDPRPHPWLSSLFLACPLLVVKAATMTLPVEFDMLVLRHFVFAQVIIT